MTDAAHDWRDDALCLSTDPEVFFPIKGASSAPARRVCLDCEVTAECLEWALEHDERWGVWGGISERPRKKMHSAYNETRKGRNVG